MDITLMMTPLTDAREDGGDLKIIIGFE